MEWTVEFHPDCSAWFEGLEEDLQDEILANLRVLSQLGPALGRPRVDTVKDSAYPNMKELRVQYKGDPWRILFAFDPERVAIVLVGGNKGGDNRWYKTNIPIADARYKQHLEELEKEKEHEKDAR